MPFGHFTSGRNITGNTRAIYWRDRANAEYAAYGDYSDWSLLTTQTQTLTNGTVYQTGPIHARPVRRP